MPKKTKDMGRSRFHSRTREQRDRNWSYFHILIDNMIPYLSRALWPMRLHFPFSFPFWRGSALLKQNGTFDHVLRVSMDPFLAHRRVENTCSPISQAPKRDLIREASDLCCEINIRWTMCHTMVCITTHQRWGWSRIEAAYPDTKDYSWIVGFVVEVKIISVVRRHFSFYNSLAKQGAATCNSTPSSRLWLWLLKTLRYRVIAR